METVTVYPMAQVRMSIVRDLLYFFEAQGASRLQLMTQAGISEALFNQADSMVSIDQVDLLWEQAVLQTGRIDLGLEMGSQASPAILGIVGHLYQSCPHLLEAMRCLERFNALFGNSIKVEVVEMQERVGLAFYPASKRNPNNKGVRQALDAWMSACRYIFQRVVVSHPLPLLVQISTEGSVNMGPYKKHFGAAELEFKASQDVIWFDRKSVEIPLITHDPELYSYFYKLAQSQLDQLQGVDRIASKVQQMLLSEFNNGFMSIEQLADKFHMTPRTLQRRLQACGFTFSQILEEVKQEMSMKLLRSRKYAIAEIAYMLGFSEPGSFSRSFRKWTGQTPRSFLN